MRFFFYNFLKVTLGIPFRVFFTKIYIDGLENIPRDKPVLLTSNHPGSFLDGVIYEYFLRRKVFTMVRGDVFKKPLFNAILRSMRLLPIFRPRDADTVTARSGNSATYEECYRLFQKNKAILIFPEGVAYPEKALAKIKNGVGVMASEMMQRSDFEMDLYIVPCAVNYSQFGRLRVALHMAFTEPIRLKDRRESIENDRKFNAGLAQEIEKRIAEVFVQTKGEYFEEKELAHTILLNELNEPMFFKEKGKKLQILAASVDKIDNPEQAALFRKYAERLKSLKIKDRNVAGKGFNYLAIFYALFTAAVSFPAFLLHKAAWYMALRFTRKKVKNMTFFDSIHFGMGTTYTYLWFVILCLVIFNSQSFYWAVFILIAAVTGSVAWFRFFDEVSHLKTELTWLSMSDEKKAALKQMREELLSFLK